MSRRLRLPASNPELAGLPVYQPGRTPRPGAFKLASNENSYGPPAVVRRVLRRFSRIERYPDGSASLLRAALARRLGLKDRQLLVGAGSDEIGDFLARAYLGKADAVLYPRYTFIRYGMSAQSVGARRIESPVREDFAFNISGLIRDISRFKPKMICVANPNNPTGAYISRTDLLRILRRTPPRTLVVLDEAYFEYAALAGDYPDGIRLLGHFPNLVVLRTFSKIYGLASLRVGFAAAHPDIITELHKVRPPFNVNALAQAAAVAALRDRAHVRRCALRNARELKRVAGRLTRAGYRVFPSIGNFLMVGSANRALDGRAWFQKLERAGVVVRDLIPYGLPHLIRITIGTRVENDRLIRAMERLS